MGLPLLLLGTSGGKLLPKAGAWMDVIKQLFGFALLAVPILLLSRLWSDQVTTLAWLGWGCCCAATSIITTNIRAIRWGAACAASCCCWP